MNKKIYFNHKFIEITEQAGEPGKDPALKVYSEPDDISLEKIIREFIEAPTASSVRIVLAGDFKKVLNRIKKSFSYIEAAGGFIEKENEFLFIHRHGRWDLPKGKLEKNETVEVAAIRECEEECGVKDLSILHPLPSTFHIYPYKGGYALKQTYWFYMRTNYSQALTPQLEEDIDQVKWFGKKDILSTLLNDTYYTISDTVKQALKL